MFVADAPTLQPSTFASKLPLTMRLAAGAAVACALYRRHLWYRATASWSGLGQAWKQFYYSSFQRPDGLVIGCLVALCLHGLRPTRLRRIVADLFAGLGV